MLKRLFETVNLLLLFCVSKSLGFSLDIIQRRPNILSTGVQRRSVSSLQTSSTSLFVSGAILQESEDEARYWLARAQECAYSTGRFCSVEEAEQCLNEIIDIESACEMGIMLADDVCDVESQSTEGLPEIVSRLRQRVQKETANAMSILDLWNDNDNDAASNLSASRQYHKVEGAKKPKATIGAYLLLAILWLLYQGDHSKRDTTWWMLRHPTAEDLFPKGFL